MAAKDKSFKSLQKEVEKWTEIRKKTSNSTQELVNLVNRSSYMTNNKVHNAFGDAVMPSRLLAMLMDEISEKTTRLHSLQNDMLQCLKQIGSLQLLVYPSIVQNTSIAAKDIIIPSSSSSCLMDLEVFNMILRQMQQQTLLEMCIVEELFGPGDDEEEEEEEEEDEDDDCQLNGVIRDSTDLNNIENNDSQVRTLNSKIKNINRNKDKQRTSIASGVIRDQDAAVTMLACFSYPPYFRYVSCRVYLFCMADDWLIVFSVLQLKYYPFFLSALCEWQLFGHCNLLLKGFPAYPIPAFVF